jgi:type IV secretion system protein VirB9
MIRAAILALACCATAPSLAAEALEGDDRVVTVAYRDGETIPLRTAIGNGLAIVFAPGERIVEFWADDPAAFELSASGSADSLFVRTLRQPASSRLTVHTHLRSYAFALDVGPAETASYAVRFDFAPQRPSSAAPVAAPAGQYKLSGTKALRPTRIDDDGVHTYLEWAPEQLLPAVFALNELGGEEMVDGYMRGGVYTIDRVNRVLLFRIDRKSAKAERIAR